MSNCPFAVLYEIFKPNHQAVTVMLPVDASVNDILTTLVDPERNYVLVKMNSSGGKLWDSDDLASEFPLTVPELLQFQIEVNISFCPTYCKRSEFSCDQSFFCFASCRQSPAQAGDHGSVCLFRSEREAFPLLCQPSGTTGERCQQNYCWFTVKDPHSSHTSQL